MYIKSIFYIFHNFTLYTLRNKHIIDIRYILNIYIYILKFKMNLKKFNASFGIGQII